MDIDYARTIALEAYTRQDATWVIHEVERIVSENHNWITDFRKYSKFLVSFIIETEPVNILKLAEAIAALDMKIYPDNFSIEIAELQQHIRPKDAEVNLALTIHFIQDQMDFREKGD